VITFDLQAHEQARILRAARAALTVAPRTVTAVSNPRSAGGRQDFSSEGDYWWPDPQNPSGPYIRRDGLSNPDNFSAHRLLLIEFAELVSALAAAFAITSDDRFAAAALHHLRAWFVNPATRMNANLAYAQAIHGVCTGRGIGIIDTVHLAEVALATEAVRNSAAWQTGDDAIIAWFAAYLQWLTTHPHAVEERDEANNHGTCWALQAAAFARVSANSAMLHFCRRHLLEVLLPTQMAPNGSFPLELARTKPYAYSLFNLDVMSALARMLSTPDGDLLAHTRPDGRSLVRGMQFIAPFVANKARWPYAHDVMYWQDWPVRHPSLLFAAQAAGRRDWLELWKRLPADPQEPEIRRNFPIRFPTLWNVAPLTP
jgi:hypothetical protein